MDTLEIKIFMVQRWHVVLQHPDGREEISHKHFSSREECEIAIEQYAEEREGQLKRVQ